MKAFSGIEKILWRFGLVTKHRFSDRVRRCEEREGMADDELGKAYDEIGLLKSELVCRTAELVGWEAVGNALEPFDPEEYASCRTTSAESILRWKVEREQGIDAQYYFDIKIDSFMMELDKTLQRGDLEYHLRLQEYVEDLYFTNGKQGPVYEAYQKELLRSAVSSFAEYDPSLSPKKLVEMLQALERSPTWPAQEQGHTQDLQREAEDQQKEDEHVKRFRTPDGALTMPVDMIAKLTRTEADAYFVDGADYIFQGEAYKLHRFLDKDAHGEMTEVAKFVSADGKQLFTDPERLGTFLPDVASDGQEITRADQVLSCANEFTEEEELEI